MHSPSITLCSTGAWADVTSTARVSEIVARTAMSQPIRSMATAIAAPMATPATGLRVTSSSDGRAEDPDEQELDPEHEETRPPVASDQIIMSNRIVGSHVGLIVRRRTA